MFDQLSDQGSWFGPGPLSLEVRGRP
jgi:hypothetical protein